MKTSLLLALGITATLFGTSGIGYYLGCTRAEAQGRAALNALTAEWAEERRASAEAYGDALAKNLARLEQEQENGRRLSADLQQQQQQHGKEARQLRKEIARVCANSAYSFSPDFVRLYNQAIGICPDALPEALHSSGAHGSAGRSGAADPELYDPFSGVSEQDLLTHISRYGRRCRGLEAQLRALQDLLHAQQ